MFKLIGLVVGAPSIATLVFIFWTQQRDQLRMLASIMRKEARMETNISTIANRLGVKLPRVVTPVMGVPVGQRAKTLGDGDSDQVPNMPRTYTDEDVNDG